MKRNAFAEIKPKDMKCPRVLFQKWKDDSEFIVSGLKSFRGSLCSFDKIITRRMNRRLPSKDFKYKEFSWDVVINVVKIKLHRKSKEVYFNNDINDEISFFAIPIT